MTLVISTADANVAVGFHAVRLAGFDDPFVRRLARVAPTAFSTPGFLAALFDTIGAEMTAEPVLIGVSDGEGRPVALFPFSLRRQGNLRLIEGMGLGVSDYYAPILASGIQLDATSAAALWRAVRAALPPADVLRLINVPAGLYGEAHALSAAGFLRPMGHSATVLPLAGLALAELSVTRDVRRKQKKLAALGEVRFFEATGDAEINDLMDAVVRFRRDRFAQMGRRDKLDDPGVTAFYRRLATERLARAYGLSVGGEIVAVVYGLAHDGVFTLIIPTMSADERFQAGSPGLVSLYLAIEASIAAGDRVFDFSVGDLFYKTRFAAEKVELYQHVEARSLLGLLPALNIRARTTARLFRQRHAGKLERLKSLLKRSDA
jgi:CelD/BcsL family acetyltransferase involved in cellulose biosynthesis